MPKLDKQFFARNTKVIAKQLLGKILVKGGLKGKIVETEAYLGKNDPASHAYKITKRSKIMLMEPGTIYIYFTYGNHYMFNIVTENIGKPGAVLIRALEPLQGIEIMKKNRNINDIARLCNGPGCVTQSFGINKKYNGQSIIDNNEIYIEDSNEKPKIIRTSRIGISQGKDLKLRFYIKDNKFVSRK
ncbi:MAG: DNA-3-methyladenine glycosylase [Candidatus Aenigmarchaeota archaeon]|nr:DNA-3-methyladenine glycosylase [Candidatus Aenigmarchaeota archaeon]